MHLFYVIKKVTLSSILFRGGNKVQTNSFILIFASKIISKIIQNYINFFKKIQNLYNTKLIMDPLKIRYS